LKNKGSESKQITYKYGFILSEKEMSDFIEKGTKIQGKDYSQLVCLDCLKLTNKMLVAEMVQPKLETTPFTNNTRKSVDENYSFLTAL
jgi:hypothetical protein